MRPRGLRAASLLSVIVLLLAACGGEGGDTSEGDGQEQEQESGPIIVGIANAQTGPFSGYDIPITQAAQIAVDDINAEGGVLGRDLELVVADTASDLEQVPNAAADVIDQGAKVVIAQCDFDFGAPGALVAQENEIPAFSCASSPKYGVQGIGPYAFSFASSSNVEGAVTAEWPYFEQGWRSTYILLDDTIAYSQDHCANFETRWTEIAGSDSILGKDTFQNGDPSIRAQITRIRNLPEQPDFIVMCTYLPGGASAVRQIREAGIDVPVVAGIGLDGNSWIEAVPDLSDFYAAHFVSLYGDDPNPEVNAFVDKFTEETGQFPITTYVAMGYSMVQAFARAVEAAGTTDGPAVRDAVEAFNEEPLLVGPTSFSADTHIEMRRPMAIVQTDGGEQSLVTYYAPQEVPPIDLG